jgi:uncharacterized phiE125 gp8 family phage protein
MGLTITTPAVSTELTTVLTVKESLGITHNKADSVIERLIKVATEKVEDYIGFILARQTYRELVIGTARTELLLTATPIQSITQILIDSGVITDYEIADADVGIIYRQQGWQRGVWIGWDAESYVLPGTGDRAITVDYIAGYLMPPLTGRDLPAKYEEAAIIAISSWIRSTQRGGSDVKSKKVGDLAIEYNVEPGSGSHGLPADARALLSQRAV